MRISDWSSDVCSSDLVHRREDPVGVHVVDAGVHVEAARAQLRVGAGVEAPLLTRPPDGGRHAEGGGGLLTLELPLVDAVLVADDLGGLVLPLRGHVVLVQIGSASCRARVCQYVSSSLVDVPLITNTHN